MSLAEIRLFPDCPRNLFDLLWRGCYPAIYDRVLEPRDWYPSYVSTYLERDVRMILNVGDRVTFQTFLRLCAGRVGQLVNLSSLGADAGVTHGTARSWVSVLEASYIAWRLPPFHANISKRLVKTPKLHFVDTGLICYLLGIHTPEQLRNHPLRGAIFEAWVASEILKARTHLGLPPSLSFYRDRKGLEVDLVVELGRSLLAVESKSGETVAADFFDGLEAFASLIRSSRSQRAVRKFLVYGGGELQARSAGTAIPWSELDQCEWWDPAE